MRENIEFQSSDNATLRGWFYKPDDTQLTLPCLVMAHGFSGIKEMSLDSFAETIVSCVAISCLVYDNRGFGDSDSGPGQPRHEILPSAQISDYSEAITYAQSRSDVIKDKIGIWGSSYSGGHVLVVGATDRRVKAVLTQVPCVDGWASFHRATRPDFLPKMNQMFEDGMLPLEVGMNGTHEFIDRRARAEGQSAGLIPVVDEDPLKPSALPTPDNFRFFSAWEKKGSWRNEVTIRSYVPLKLFIAVKGEEIAYMIVVLKL